MKPRLQTSLGQHLVHDAAVASGHPPVAAVDRGTRDRDRQRGGEQPAAGLGRSRAAGTPATATTTRHGNGAEPRRRPPARRRLRHGTATSEPGTSASARPTATTNRVAEQVAEAETLHDHLLWQLHLSHLSPRDRTIGVALIEAIDDDGYLRETDRGDRRSLLPGNRRAARRDPDRAAPGAALRSGRASARVRSANACSCSSRCCPTTRRDANSRRRMADGPLERLPQHRRRRAWRTNCIARVAEIEMRGARCCARSTRAPARRSGGLSADTYVTPDCVVWRQQGHWRVALAAGARPRISIHRGYERMIRRPARPTRSTCAATCRKRAGCSRAWKRAATRCSR